MFVLPLAAEGARVDVAGDGVADAISVEAEEVDEGAGVDDALDDGVLLELDAVETEEDVEGAGVDDALDD